MILTVTLNPALDRTIILPQFTVNTINRVQETRLDPGGKGINVSKTLQVLGEQTLCLGILGGASGGYIKSALDQMELPNDMVLTGEPTRTNLKLVDPVNGTCTEINEPGRAITMEELQKVWEKLAARVQPTDTVVFSGSNPPGTPPRLLAAWIRQLRGAGVKTALDTTGKPLAYALREKPDLLKPNRRELEELVGMPLRDNNLVFQAARALTEMGIGLVAVSLGKEGAMLVTRREAVLAHAPETEVCTAVGCGDAMLAALVTRLDAPMALEEKARYAVAVGTADVLTPGTQPPAMEEIQKLLPKIRVERIEGRPEEKEESREE